jgi:hypothetical protein
MKRTITSIITATLLVSVFATSAFAEKVGIVYDFNNKSLAPWTGNALSASATVPAVETLALGADKYGNHFARLTNAGANAVWMEARFKAVANTLVMEWNVAGLKNADRLAPIVYVGKYSPGSLYEFQLTGSPLEKGSQHIQFEMSLKEAGLQGNAFTVALGFMNLDNVNEIQSAAIDDVQLTIYDR